MKYVYEESLYSIQKHKDRNEWHIFISKKKDGCILNPKSICKKMLYEDANLPENENVEYLCLTEDKARKLTANIGRKVCGICVSHLYETYD